ncbi:unnamed protein product [Trifolium pratense]|uniref:Uncharacterized protein n=1 Tax=Trifolium pratense TaxID=57577 RepID=A0ACB0J7S1_TRIPR|nr:unnamed protein product [Trifolium pratense]
MAKIIKFVCVMIIIFSLFLAATNAERGQFIYCKDDSECQNRECLLPWTQRKCLRFGICVCAMVYPET